MQIEPDKWPLVLARPRGQGKQSLGCGGGGNLLMGLGKSQKVKFEVSTSGLPPLVSTTRLLCF